MRRWILAAASLLGMALLMIVLARAQEPSPGGAPTIHVPIKLPTAAPSGWPAELWEKYHKRCQEVADLSAANPPMDSSDCGFADWCTKQGAFYSPVKQRPIITPTAVVTPGPDGHIPSVFRRAYHRRRAVTSSGGIANELSVRRLPMVSTSTSPMVIFAHLKGALSCTAHAGNPRVSRAADVRLADAD